MGDRVPAPPGVVDECIDPSLLTLHSLHMDVQSVSTPDHVDFDDCGTVEDGGSARSPSTVNSPSTSSDFSSYAGSTAESPSDVGFFPAGIEQDSPAVAQSPTGNTMHGIPPAQHRAVQEMAMPANEFAALLDGYARAYNQAQLDMIQAYDFNNTMHSIPNPPAIMMQSNGNPSSET